MRSLHTQTPTVSQFSHFVSLAERFASQCRLLITFVNSLDPDQTR